jgi:hypothetical protein
MRNKMDREDRIRIIKIKQMVNKKRLRQMGQKEGMLK